MPPWGAEGAERPPWGIELEPRRGAPGQFPSLPAARSAVGGAEPSRLSVEPASSEPGHKERARSCSLEGKWEGSRRRREGPGGARPKAAFLEGRRMPRRGKVPLCPAQKRQAGRQGGLPLPRKGRVENEGEAGLPADMNLSGAA